MRKPIVIDTNVLVTAESRPGTSLACADRCQKELLDIQRDGCVVLDSGWQIIKEYRNNLPGSGQPGIGFRFFQMLLNNRTDPKLCSLVDITDHNVRGFNEFPEHPGLLDFDPDDRKFVAVAATHPGDPAIIQATDSKWIGWQRALEECGIAVNFICKAEIRAAYARKKGLRV